MKKQYLAVIFLAAFVIGWFGGSMISPQSAAEIGDQITVDYWLTVDGELLETSTDSQPLMFTIGGGQMIAGFESAVIGMKVGEEKEVSIPPAEAYGEINPDSDSNHPLAGKTLEFRIKLVEIR
jgi:FKBP-type peptidyl-prolyl cis-trans isomerase 2